MRWPPYSIPIGITVIALGGMVATGCDDSGGLRSGKTDGGASDAATSLGGQAGFDSSSGGTAGSPGTGGAAGSLDAGDSAGTKGTGGEAGSGGTIASGGATGGGSGGVDAAGDVSKPDGGMVDVAADAGAWDAPAPDARVVSDSSVAPDVKVVCGPVCLMYCTYGNLLDENGCELCACNSPPPCPAMKCQACPYGYVHDANGCLTCTCLPDPRLPCSQLDATQCGASANCRWLVPGCAVDETPLPAPGCFDRVNCLSTSDCSETGSTCVERSAAPPEGPGGDWCGMAVSVCL